MDNNGPEQVVSMLAGLLSCCLFPVLVFGALALAVGAIVFWIIMLIDAVNRTNWQNPNDKNTWILVLVITFVTGLGFIGALIYYFSVRRKLGPAR